MGQDKQEQDKQEQHKQEDLQGLGQDKQQQDKQQEDKQEDLKNTLVNLLNCIFGYTCEHLGKTLFTLSHRVNIQAVVWGAVLCGFASSLSDVLLCFCFALFRPLDRSDSFRDTKYPLPSSLFVIFQYYSPLSGLLGNLNLS